MHRDHFTVINCYSRPQGSGGQEQYSLPHPQALSAVRGAQNSPNKCWSSLMSHHHKTIPSSGELSVGSLLGSCSALTPQTTAPKRPRPLAADLALPRIKKRRRRSSSLAPQPNPHLTQRALLVLGSLGLHGSLTHPHLHKQFAH